jgi:hypothetical protein
MKKKAKWFILSVMCFSSAIISMRGNDVNLVEEGLLAVAGCRKHLSFSKKSAHHLAILICKCHAGLENRNWTEEGGLALKHLNDSGKSCRGAVNYCKYISAFPDDYGSRRWIFEIHNGKWCIDCMGGMACHKKLSSVPLLHRLLHSLC